MNELRKNLPPLPDRMRKLPVDVRGYPIPWFVETQADGTRDFRIASAKKRVVAVKARRCWICGEPMGKFMAFVIGPMCAINRNTSEPGSHLECGQFAAQACPFMILPKAEYRRAGLPEDATQQAPHAIPGNPGAVCIWVTQRCYPYNTSDQAGRRGWLIRLGDPEQVLWYCEGRVATRAQILDCFDRRLPALSSVAEQDGPEAMRALAKQVEATKQLLPA